MGLATAGRADEHGVGLDLIVVGALLHGGGRFINGAGGEISQGPLPVGSGPRKTSFSFYDAKPKKRLADGGFLV